MQILPCAVSALCGEVWSFCVGLPVLCVGFVRLCADLSCAICCLCVGLLCCFCVSLVLCVCGFCCAAFSGCVEVTLCVCVWSLVAVAAGRWAGYPQLHPCPSCKSASYGLFFTASGQWWTRGAWSPSFLSWLPVRSDAGRVLGLPFTITWICPFSWYIWSSCSLRPPASIFLA